MTICISVSVAEGLVLAADSAVMLEGVMQTKNGQQKKGILQTFEFANKVAQIKDYPIGVMSWGIASIGDRSIQSLIMEFEYDYPLVKDNQSFTVKEVADKLLEFMMGRYNTVYAPNGNRPHLGIFVGGYSHYSKGNFFSDQYVYSFPQSQNWEIVRPNKPDGSPSFGVNWYGQTDALIRLVKGYDLAGLDELVKRGVDKEIIAKWATDNVTELPLVFDGMPLQDAVDFSNYAVQVVIGRFRFGVGPPLCGGKIDIAVITPAAFHWAQRKQWSIKE